jgi:hypothetical protein
MERLTECPPGFMQFYRSNSLIARVVTLGAEVRICFSILAISISYVLLHEILRGILRIRIDSLRLVEEQECRSVLVDEQRLMLRKSKGQSIGSNRLSSCQAALSKFDTNMRNPLTDASHCSGLQTFL